MQSINKIAQLSLVALLMCASALTTPSWAQNASRVADAREGMPGRRVGGGVRQATAEVCLPDQLSQIALTPDNNLLLTAKANPTFLFYLPATRSARTVEFVLANENNEELYVTTTQANETSGIVRLNLSESTNSVDLEANQNYRWYLSVVCNESDRANDIVAEGWIRRTDETGYSAELSEPTIAAAEQQRQVGLWSDALAIMDMLRRQEPDNSEISERWVDFLETIDLRDLADEAPVEQDWNRDVGV